MSAELATTESLEIAEPESEALPLPEISPESKPKNPLNPKQKKFLKNILQESMFPTDAYMDAYETPEDKRWNATNAASRLMCTNVYIRNAIEDADEIQEQETRRFLIGKSPSAAQRMSELMESEDGHIAFRAAKEILYMTGHKPGDNVKHSGEVTFNLARAIMDGEV